MSFIVRTVARTADGRDIVRPKPFDTKELTVGRSPDCDIHLADLAVTLHHVTIRDSGAGTVEAVATAGLPFVVDGKSTEHAWINIAEGAIIRIGSHALTVAIGEGDDQGRTIITVERVGAISNASEAKEETRVFSLAAVLPGKRPLAWVLALLILGVFLVWPLISIYSQPTDAARKVAFHADEMWTSGKLSSVHRALENNCQACHVKAGQAVRDDACVACHTKVHDHADPKRLAAAMGSPGIVGGTKRLVASAFNIPPGRCVECHTEHQGATAMPVTDEKFCTNCHTDLNTRLADTNLKNAADFGDNHPQFEPTIRFAAANGQPATRRVSLDANPKEDSGLKFPHALHLSAANGVARMAISLGKDEGYGAPLQCVSCHVRDATGSTFAPVKMESSCGACHSLAFDQVDGTVRTLRHGDPAQVVADIRAFYRSGAARPAVFAGMARHRPGETAGRGAGYVPATPIRVGNADQAIRAVFSKGGACFDCHQVKPTGQASAPFAVTPVVLAKRYMMKGWFDHAAHDTESCASCHAVKTSNSASDVNLPKIARCQECHGGQEAHKAVPSSCAMCHDYHRTGFAPLMVRDSRARGKAHDAIDRKSLTAAGAGA